MTARALAGAALLAVVVWLVGPDPFVTGVRAVGPGSLLATAVLTAVATTACAWRWSLVARGLGLALPLGAAVRACYRAQLLNLLLPGGVAGDVHRGWRHGLRAVAWERVAGQAVQGLVLVVALLVLSGPVELGPGLGVVLAGVVLVALAVLVRGGLGSPRARAGVVASSLVALAAHVTTFAVAARAVGVELTVGRLVPLALLVLVAASIPVHLGGWGPREGMAVWSFAAAGLGGAAGAATATAYGVLVLAAHLPALLLLVPRRRTGSEQPLVEEYAGG